MRPALSGTPKRTTGGRDGRPRLKDRDHASPGSWTAATSITCQASAAVAAKIETQSSERQAGTTPRADSAPRDGFSPTILLRAAGTRPEPAVSVPSAKETRPSATATPDPEEEPPGTSLASMALRGTGYGVRTPTRPVANWSRLVLPMRMAPASTSRWTTGADSAGV